MRKTSQPVLVLGLICALAFFLCAGCSTSSKEAQGPSKEVVFADPGWDSVKINNSLAGLIAVEAFGYESWSQMNGSTPIIHEAILNAQIDILMEAWTQNIDSYLTDLEANKFKELGINFDDNKQGWYVPRYVIDGDNERGIAPVAPDLKSVGDLKKYANSFPDDETAGKGRIYGAIPGWKIDDIMNRKYEFYGLDEFYTYFRPGSDSALSAALVSAYEKGVPIVGYYWEPTWLMGKYDFVLLEDAPYVDEEDFVAGKTECPAVKVTIMVSNNFAENNSQFCEFLSKFSLSSASLSQALAYMQETGASHDEAAKWLLIENDQWLDEWLSEDQAAKVRQTLK